MTQRKTQLFIAYTQLTDGTVYQLELKPLKSREDARNAVAAAKVVVLECGEEALNDVLVPTTRAAYQGSMGQNSIWYERV